MSVTYYIYYRVDPARVAQAEGAVARLLAEVTRTTGVAGEVKHKRGEPCLWMEIFSPVANAADFEAALAHAFDKSGLAACLTADQRRHVECFIDPSDRAT